MATRYRLLFHPFMASDMEQRRGALELALSAARADGGALGPYTLDL